MGIYSRGIITKGERWCYSKCDILNLGYQIFMLFVTKRMRVFLLLVGPHKFTC